MWEQLFNLLFTVCLQLEGWVCLRIRGHVTVLHASKDAQQEEPMGSYVLSYETYGQKVCVVLAPRSPGKYQQHHYLLSC